MKLVNLLDDEIEVEKKQRVKAIHNSLQEAAINGSAPSLLQILQQHPQILNTLSHSHSDTPLHLASLLGHSAFAKLLLNHNPDLTSHLNQQGSSPLHLAAAKGYVDIVKDLLLVNPDMCLVWDRQGRTPLHLAAIKGRIGVLAEFVRVKPEATRVFTSTGDSALHLCVKFNRPLEALKVFVECVRGDDEFVNWRDSHGNTVLHLAVTNKQLQVCLLFFIYIVVYFPFVIKIDSIIGGCLVGIWYGTINYQKKKYNTIGFKIEQYYFLE